MTDPLATFDWTTLYARYDGACEEFDQHSPHLGRFGLNRPRSDRELYYQLIAAWEPTARNSDADLVSVFEALLYWKYYSMKQFCATNMGKLTNAGSGARATSAASLQRLNKAFPVTVPRDAATVVTLVESLSDYNLPCMGECAIPTRTTFLHFLYPNVVPILDRQVLTAVGEDGDGNKSYSVLRKYLPFAWELADRYGQIASEGHTESVLRQIDMALWVSRGKS